MVRRVIDEISKLAGTCSPALMLPAAANAAVYALTELFPGSSAVICRAAADRPARVAGGRGPHGLGGTNKGQLTSQAGLASGFTLLELLVVMTVIGLMASLVAPRYFAHVGKSQVKLARAQIEELDKALDTFRIDVGHHPTTEEGLQGLVEQPNAEPNWAGPYLKKKDLPKDPWGRPYVYQQPGTHGSDFDLFSYGKDGRPGGTGEDADITNW